LEKFLNGLFGSITSGLRKFVAFAMIMFFIGTAYGFFSLSWLKKPAWPRLTGSRCPCF
jgi:hypothetical protein